MNGVKIGDKVYRKPLTITGLDTKTLIRMPGTVVWVHPEGRFHVVEFQLGGGAVRECFMGVDLECCC